MSFIRIWMIAAFSTVAVNAAVTQEAKHDLPQRVPVPVERPDTKSSVGKIKPAEEAGPISPPGEVLRAAKKDERIYQVACPVLMSGEIDGTLIPPLKENNCGEQSPLKINAFGKETPVRLAAPVIINCAMATALVEWTANVSALAQKHYHSPIKKIVTGSDYQCRRVNNGSSGRTSEHAFANALDIISFTFENGKTTELKSGWNAKGAEKAFWRDLHKASCKRFMTVIGPDGDAAHENNLHLDLGCHGKDCMARICQ
ncbi:extensin family protein [Limoniibacter endophyticus]|uniref:Extensin n=1 Tax=Limoniibacter endophyticus TaxID=1565040 RepID=A0A8J3DL73_9HYPH|nr:extensin family protein [Limoniibacter endophyticus]GHC60598.1 extensin [Limoniibacter endophyticus]